MLHGMLYHNERDVNIELEYVEERAKIIKNIQ